MQKSYVLAVGSNFSPDPQENIFTSIFTQYERVIVESLITSFGLDFIVKDRHGGDVDTVHNVDQIGTDENMTYKNEKNLEDYENRGSYNPSAYHSDKQYREANKKAKLQKDAGVLQDAYTGENIPRNGEHNLDHTISAKEIHNNRGRVLAELNGVDLANSPDNLNVTNPHTNKSKKADSMSEYLTGNEDKYTKAQTEKMMQKEDRARQALKRKRENAYYTSPKFAKDVAASAISVGLKMGARQVLGLVFTEVWFAVKEEFANGRVPFDEKKLLHSIRNAIEQGFANAKEKYKELLVKLKEGMAAGALSGLATTLCNIFFTTAENIVRILRQAWTSVVQAAKILFINPDNLPFGDRMCAVAKILATGASVVVGVIVSEAIGKTPLGQLPVLGEIAQTFCGALVTGIMSCTLLYYIDRSSTIRTLVSFLNNLHFFSTEVNYFRQQAEYFEKYAVKLMNIDIKKFYEETRMYYSLATELENIKNEAELTIKLKNFMKAMGIEPSWEGTFGEFMQNKNSVLVFK